MKSQERAVRGALGGTPSVRWSNLAQQIGFGVLGILIVMGILQATKSAFPPGLMPSVSEIGRSIVHLDGNTVHQVGQTLLRLVIGMLISLVVGWLLGLVMGTVPVVGKALNPIIRGLTAVPSATWIILVVLWFRGIDVRVLFIVVATLFPMYTISVYEGVRRLDGDLVQAVGQFGPSKLQLVRMVTLPNSLSDVVVTTHVTIGLGLRILVIMELLGANSGVGFLMQQDQTGFDVAGIIALTVYMIVLTFVLLWLLKLFERWLFRWRPTNALE
jgi:ABC-type nitrate/sulfonate/bicarbonate transport system permease component